MSGPPTALDGAVEVSESALCTVSMNSPPCSAVWPFAQSREVQQRPPTRSGFAS